MLPPTKYRNALRELERLRAQGGISKDEHNERSIKIWARIERLGLYHAVVYGETN